MIKEVQFPWGSRHYFTKALRKGAKWVFRTTEMDGSKSNLLVLSVFNMQNKLRPDLNHVRVLFSAALPEQKL